MSLKNRFVTVTVACLIYAFLFLLCAFEIGQMNTGDPAADPYAAVTALYVLLGSAAVLVCKIINRFASRQVLHGPAWALILVLGTLGARLAAPEALFQLGNYLWQIPLPGAVAIIRMPLFILTFNARVPPAREPIRIGFEISAALIPLLVFVSWHFVIRHKKRGGKTANNLSQGQIA